MTIARQVIAGDIKDLAGSRKDAIKACEKLGVTAARVFAFLEVQGEEDITVNHLVDLSGALNAIQDGETTVTATFPPIDVDTDKPGRRTFGKGAIKQPEPPPIAAEPEKAKDPNDGIPYELAAGTTAAVELAPDRESCMAPGYQSSFWKKADKECGSHPKALRPVQDAVDKLRGEGKLPATCLDWRDITNEQHDMVLAAIVKPS
jgi:hypothetical protein